MIQDYRKEYDELGTCGPACLCLAPLVEQAHGDRGTLTSGPGLFFLVSP